MEGDVDGVRYFIQNASEARKNMHSASESDITTNWIQPKDKTKDTRRDAAHLTVR